MNFVSSLGRIFWKEYRAQRSVWLALLFGTVLLQCLVFVRGEGRLILPASFPFAMALAVSVCFAATVVAILFAGEREDETDEWLAQLPIPASWLLGGKLVLAVLATILFVAVTLLAGGMIALLADMPGGRIVGDHPEVLPRAMLGAFAWGLFFSLLTGRVLGTLICTATAEIITTGIAGNIFREFDQRIYFGIVGCVLVADVWLARRWAARLPIIPAGPIGLRGGNAASGRLRSGWLSRVVSSGNPSVRTSGALIWRELRGAVPVLLGWGVLGVFCVDLQLRFLSFIPTHLLFLLVTPVVCGMMTCLGDQRRQSFRFLAERGVSASTVWLHKQLVWGGIGLAVVASFACWDVLTPGRSESTADRYGAAGAYPTTPDLLHGAYVTLVQQRVMMNAPYLQQGFVETPADTSPLWSCVASLGLALFSVGQMASFWIRRAVLVAAAAFIIGAITSFWHWTALVVDLPLLWNTWPIGWLCLAATWCTSFSWLREERGWKILATRTGWLFVMPLLLLAVARHSRATQVPDVPLPFDWRDHARELQSYDAALSDQVMGRPISSHEISNITLSSNEIRNLSEELTDRTRTPGLAPNLIAGRQRNLPEIGSRMAMSADTLVAAGQLDAAWIEITAGLRVSEFFSTQATNWGDWLNCLLAREFLYEAARNWAEHPDQSPALLRQAVGDLEEFSVDRWSSEAMLQNRYVVYRQLMDREGPLWDQVQSSGFVYVSPNGHVVSESSIEFLRWAGERERLLRLMGILTTRSLQRSQPDNNHVPAAISVDSRASDAEIVRWVGTTSNMVNEFAVDLWIDVDGRSTVDFQVLEALAWERGTILLLAVQTYRLEHEAFPDQLADLTADVIEELPRDPYNGADFGYAAAGFESPVVPIYDFTIPDHKPLLWSTGPMQADLTFRAEPFTSPVGIVPGDRYVASPLGRKSGAPGTAGVSDLMSGW